MDAIQKTLLEQVADLHEIPEGAYSLRINGQLAGKNSSENIVIEKKEDLPGIDIFIKPGTKKESVHIPVLIAQTGLKELVYNDFHVGEDCDVVIVAGCGIHNAGDQDSEHSGVHRFFLGKNSKVKYVEKHYGQGDGNGKNIMNPVTEVILGEGAYLEMETTQIKGVDSTKRLTKGSVAANATFIVKEKLLTHGSQFAETSFEVTLDGENANAHVVSRSVAKEKSKQLFTSRIDGNNLCSGRSECDAIIMDDAVVSAIPEINANHPDASLVHEAAIGRIAGEQLIKLMTLGLTEKEAEEQIINGFLK
ncbi:MAG: SufD family Fe-S cluster assembly protein [Oscillospiraceae bacterium]|nr:SufD family Fe-S cluster assembly protein [Oscillospiraceae bacterium]